MKRMIAIMLACVILSGCSDKMADLQQIREYCSGFYDEAYRYVLDLDYSSEDLVPESIEVSLYSAEKDFLKTERTFEEVLEGQWPVLQIDLRRSEKRYSEKEIDEVLHLIQDKGNRINLVFDGDDARIYEVSPDSIMIEIMSGADGGTRKDKKAYVYGEK